MLVTKNLNRGGTIIFLAFVIFLAGCSPPGPRALLKGKKLLDRGDYAGAVAELKTATSFLATNAQVWNYYGVALQGAGQPADAATAYQRALALNRDLVEAHYNLGCLWLEQNKPDAAKTEFTAYTLRRGNATEGWLKLGSAQLRTGELVPSEKSFSTALYLNPNNAEALNGLGLARIKRGRPQEAAKFFSAAIQNHPDYAPAILNLATVEQQYLRDTRAALQQYRAYLALTPRPANWDEVNVMVDSLGQPATLAVMNPPPANQNQTVASAPSGVSETRTQTIVRPVTSPRVTPTIHFNSNLPPRVTPVPVQVVKVQPGPVIVATPNPPGTTAEPAVELPPEPATEKHGFLHKLNPIHWFGSSKPENKYADNGVTPLPSPDSNNDRVNSTPLLPPNPTPAAATSSPPVNTPPVSQKPVHMVAPAPPSFPRYLYLSPRRPKSGDRVAASGAFTRAREFEQDSRWADAMQSYKQASEFDPGWFEAQYNYAVLAYRLRNFNLSLAAYEKSLAIQPDSVDARYNFALALKAAGYALDAVNELKKITAASPDEVRAHLALGNLYAQQLHDAAKARQHYLKVLDLDPRNPQATDIRFWLSANPS
jgi:tetratricopeptide (TPR) repeat protein